MSHNFIVIPANFYTIKGQLQIRLIKIVQIVGLSLTESEHLNLCRYIHIVWGPILRKNGKCGRL